MPHATSEMPTTNGTSPSSKFLNHLTSYPVVSDSVETFKSHPVGRKSIDLGTRAYNSFAKPVEPYLETPYSYAKPYVAKADELADSGLGRVESTFPIVKEDTHAIVDKGKSIVWYPFKLADDGKNYLVDTWQEEYKNTARGNGEGIQTFVKAVVSTELRIASDLFQTISDFLSPKYQEGKDKVAELTHAAQEKAGEVQKKGEEWTKAAQGKAQEVQKEGEKKGEQVKQDAKQVKEDAKSKANQK